MFVERANHSPLLLGQSMSRDQWPETLHHFFSGAQQQHRQVAVQNSGGRGHGGKEQKQPPVLKGKPAINRQPIDRE
jgi:hypothetical protein